MNTTLQAFSERYLEALRIHLTESHAANLASADELGRESQRMDLGVPGLAMIHEEALMALMSSEQIQRNSDGTIRRIGIFFRQALESSLTCQGALPVKQLETREPAALNAVKKRLQRETAKRQSAERSLKDELRQYGKLLEESKIMQKELRHLSHVILLAQEEERKKISRELHDEISQILTGINVRLAALRIESMANATNISEKIVSTQLLVEKSVATVHRFARELRPAMLDDLGLIPALLAHMKEVRKHTGLQIRFTASKAPAIEAMDSLKRTMLYRVVQEALKNVAQHAQASLVNVSVQADSDHICLEVNDNGKSFSVQDVPITAKSGWIFCKITMIKRLQQSLLKYMIG